MMWLDTPIVIRLPIWAESNNANVPYGNFKGFPKVIVHCLGPGVIYIFPVPFTSSYRKIIQAWGGKVQPCRTGNWHHHHSYRRAQYQATHWLAGAQFLQMIFPKRLATVGKKYPFCFWLLFDVVFFLLVFFVECILQFERIILQHTQSTSTVEVWSVFADRIIAWIWDLCFAAVRPHQPGSSTGFFSRNFAATAPGSYTYPTQTGSWEPNSSTQKMHLGVIWEGMKNVNVFRCDATFFGGIQNYFLVSYM